jgi:hypothetical protein
MNVNEFAKLQKLVKPMSPPEVGQILDAVATRLAGFLHSAYSLAGEAVSAMRGALPVDEDLEPSPELKRWYLRRDEARMALAQASEGAELVHWLLSCEQAAAVLDESWRDAMGVSTRRFVQEMEIALDLYRRSPNRQTVSFDALNSACEVFETNRLRLSEWLAIAARGEVDIRLGAVELQLLSYLCNHHEYDHDGIGNSTPVGVRKTAEALATRKTKVSPGQISRAFMKLFPPGGHKLYSQLCEQGDAAVFREIRRLRGENVSFVAVRGDVNGS